jgi:hypothetical protein
MSPEDGGRGAAQAMARAAAAARRRAAAFAGPAGRDALPFALIEPFDAEIRGHVERDPRIEDERDRVLIAAVKLAETPPDEDEAVEAARAHLADAIDYLEQAVLRFGVVNRAGAKAGLGAAGARVGRSRWP